MPPVAAAFAAVAAGTATIGAVATVVSTVGLGLSVVGKVTGNESLMKIGGVMGLVGGVTSLASGAMGVANAATAAEGVAGAAGDAAFDSWAAGQGAAESTVGLDAFGGASASAGSAGEALTGGLSSANIGTTGQELPGLTAPEFTPPSDGGGLLNSKMSSPSMPSTGQPSASNANTGAAPPVDTSSGGIKEWWSKLDGKDKSALLQAGAGAVGGLFQGWTAEQKMAFERERQNLATSNANAQPIVKFGGPSVQPKTGGLLYSARSA